MKKVYNDENIKNIANAIRTKSESSDSYKVEDMAEAILNIPSGKGNIQDWLTVEENGDYLAEDYGVDGFKNVSVGVMDFTYEYGTFTPTEDDYVSGGGIEIYLQSPIEVTEVLVYRVNKGNEQDQYSPDLFSAVFREDNLQNALLFNRYKASGSTTYTNNGYETTNFKTDTNINRDATSSTYMISIYRNEYDEYIVKFKTYGNYRFRVGVDYNYTIRHRY